MKPLNTTREEREDIAKYGSDQVVCALVASDANTLKDKLASVGSQLQGRMDMAGRAAEERDTVLNELARVREDLAKQSARGDHYRDILTTRKTCHEASLDRTMELEKELAHVRLRLKSAENAIAAAVGELAEYMPEPINVSHKEQLINAAMDELEKHQKKFMAGEK